MYQLGFDFKCIHTGWNQVRVHVCRLHLQAGDMQGLRSQCQGVVQEVHAMILLTSGLTM